MAAAVQAQLEAGGSLADAAFDTVLPDGVTPPERYAVFFLQGLYEYDRQGGASPIAVDWTLTTHSVGTSVDQARWVAAEVAARLAGIRLALTGWTQTPARHSFAQPVDINRDVIPGVPFGIDQYTFRSDKE